MCVCVCVWQQSLQSALALRNSRAADLIKLLSVCLCRAYTVGLIIMSDYVFCFSVFVLMRDVCRYISIGYNLSVLCEFLCDLRCCLLCRRVVYKGMIATLVKIIAMGL